METRFVTAGPGDPVTYPIGTKDPQCFDTEAYERAIQAEADRIRKNIKGGKNVTKEDCEAMRLVLADHICRYVCDVEIIGLIEAHASGDKEKLFERFSAVLNYSVAGLAETFVEEAADD
ncbi:hypothetical protein NB636_01935 [Oxalobacter aliiformigenes]|uniref:hypothetical protein n=1 Tax=Oxalobacter aliiformigenes TaxID=2946593 RepID=UPI0022AE5C46|nr:hypothetical protein [Oxalobacter aliiformigenes]MCZ4065477.1 hypothetical protein [Oxalobacter aliiformigenes]WAV99647.1 hypothetical protein NB636_01935 [Oxalobacter aliiformigenes]